MLLRLCVASFAVMMFLSAAKAPWSATHSGWGVLEYYAQPPTRHIERVWPTGDPSLDASLAAAGVGPSDPVVYLDFTYLLNPLPFRRDVDGQACAGRHPVWLPLASPNVYMPLPAERSVAYVNRYLSHHAVGGWLVRRKAVNGQHQLELLILAEVAKTHRVGHRLEADPWLIEWYEPK